MALPSRRAAARALARELGAADLVIFHRDAEIELLLPLPGFPRTLPGGLVWRALLDAALATGEATGAVLPPAAADGEVPPAGEVPAPPSPSRGDGQVAGPTVRVARVEAWALRCSPEVVVVLLGGAPARARVRSLAPFLLLAALAIHGEQASEAAGAATQLARDSAAHGEALAVSLDHALHQAEAALAQAERANRAKADFLAAMSHELRTPLNAIGGYTELLLMELAGPLTGTQHDQLERIRANQRHLLGLINDVLNFSRLEAGRVSYHIETAPVGPLLEQAVRLVELQALAKGQQLEAGPFLAELAVRADTEKVRQIVLNLVANAIKFTPAGGAIRVWGEAVPEGVGIWVSDTGEGIPPAHQGQIFDAFVQVGRRFSSPEEGVGLGLAISRDLARGMGGELALERSVVGEGSTFRLVLPRA